MNFVKNLFLLIFLTCVNKVKAFPKGLLYHHGVGHGDAILPKENDVSSPEIKLSVPIIFFGEEYDSIYVNSNGLLSFQTEIPIFFNVPFPLNYPVIAPLYSNVDTRAAGSVSYRESTENDVLARATRNVRDSFSSASNFEAKSVFLATWTDVGYHSRGSDKKNTFQTAVISDGSDSYVEFIFPEGGIEWVRGDLGGSEGGLPDARAQSGLSRPPYLHTLPHSGTDKVHLLTKKTNMNAPGQWIFYVSNADHITEPDLYEHNQIEEEEIASCNSGGSSGCHSQAKCVDKEDGFCCVCNQHFYGNGISCIKNDVPLRANGKVSGSINGVNFDQLDLQSYIVMSDGRAYTAISKVPREIGHSAQLLSVIGTQMGFLFAKPVSGALKNGYQLTGGLFNHTANIRFRSGHSVKITQNYLGLDVFDQLKLLVRIDGNLPKIPEQEKLDLFDLEEQYTVTSPGTILSQGSHKYVYGPNQDEISYDLDQKIEYSPCKFGKTLDISTWKVKISKNYISYEMKEQILRFGMSNKVVSLEDVDPCKEGHLTCPRDSTCQVEQDTFICVCNHGYQQVFNENQQVSCIDVNECQLGLHNCDHNAACINQPGKFSCHCNHGYQGDGHYCEKIQKVEHSDNCEIKGCQENAFCLENKCQCLQGYIGGGSSPCIADKEMPCDLVNNCSPFAVCSYNQQISEYECKCQDGYHGDGYICETSQDNELDREETTPGTEKVPEQQGGKDYVSERCLLGVCWCPEGYVNEPGTRFCLKKYDDETTEASTEHENLSCSIINNCHPNAQCVFLSHSNEYQCQCNAGFEGDGYNCVEAYSSCADAEICDLEATCQYEETSKRHICICNPGFQGDGLFCEPISEAQQCSTYEDCNIETEECAYSSSSDRYECICKMGFEREPSTGACVASTATGDYCGGGICVENAQCLFDPDHQTHYCECKPDYVGDGITECKKRPIGCNVVNNCGLHASCVFDNTINSYECQCDNGFFGDGFICNTIKTCHADPYLCDFHATCIQNSDRQYVCQCNKGYVGNGSYCAVAPKHDGNFLLVNQGMATLRVPFEPTPGNMGRPIQIQHYQFAIGLDIDCIDGRVYWSDITGKSIKSSLYNGTDFKNFITQDIGSPEGLSIDWVSRNIFWTDSAKNTLEVANLESKYRKVLFSDNLVNPRGIAVHPQRGKIFWSDWNRKNPKIEWANMDGSNRQVFLSGSKIVELPNSLSIDWFTDQLCYADAGTKKIQCVNIDTQQIQTIAVNLTYPFGLAISADRFYWTDWVSQKIESVDRNLERKAPIKVPLGGSGNKLYGMAAVPEKCPQMYSPCQHAGVCPSGHLCLPNSYGKFSCICIENCQNQNRQ